MPWIAVVCLCLVGACSFEADYTGGTYACSKDGKCPPGLECRDGMCLEPRKDAAVDTPTDVMIDARLHALNCADPGPLTSGVAVSGTTASRQNLLSSSCGGIHNAPDAVYRITTTAPNQQLLVSITSSSLSAYVLNACMQLPSTVACLGGSAASDGNPISVAAAAAGDYFVVVDTINPSTMGSYTLTVTAN